MMPISLRTALLAATTGALLQRGSQ